ncbi:rap GTPase-activating protein, putative [Entamoeba dispar SAW760]|uniref:Rap GTPase-activating protein, putative n=1 Tax=Entamoeba dispar (strain ATCC PRA-260 / SAW760) TaxID=370354 RepID=B0E8K0_ENTDS|nr:rap GTPase-activating protein, putative [Entamoeba dispar SAW760]EDR29143.1 rap GTPase-activating protein, putative [Entamoeba dispar SAW760]|eukprot:EDR29143.1 rap GTPase-activating protein, putative [Entamoeba dispar SAW760]
MNTPPSSNNEIDIDDLLNEPNMTSAETIRKEALKKEEEEKRIQEEKEKAEEIRRAEEEQKQYEEEQYQKLLENQQQEQIERKMSKVDKTVELTPTLLLCHFNVEIKAIYPIPDVIYFNRKSLKSREHLFSLIDSTSFDILTTDPWSSVYYTSEDWTFAPISNEMVDDNILQDRYNIETNQNSVTFHKERRNSKMPIIEAETEFPFYETYFYNKKTVKHYLDKEDSILLSVDESKKYKKAILRTSKEYVKLVIPPDTDPTKYRNIFPKGAKVMKYSNIPQIDDELLTIEQRSTVRKYKFGVVCVKPGQDENAIFGNDEIPKRFYELMFLIAEKIKLEGFGAYSGGLDTKFNETGEFSFYTKYFNNEVMFHVAPLLPTSDNDIQKLERKRHIGNDIVVLVFLEEGVKHFDPRLFTSHFNHIFVIVQPISKEEAYTTLGLDLKESDSLSSNPVNSTQSDEALKYIDPMTLESIASSKQVVGGDKSTLDTSGLIDQFCRVSIVTKPSISPFPPYLDSGVYRMDLKFRDFLMQKMINGERTALRYPPFRTNAENTRRQQIACIAAKL